ncbi:type IA DNA topoisomerase [Paenisporosarcina sp. TG20]|uniref:type IA DNA topoisomerase n=1 Tax=Paenisporosarcina sp. TG20 TaxID=1211706 RepID=UPI0002DD2F7E|nr:type IA DNA topoisomerase [Paenisporosarcina sp. TG20]
MKPVILAEKPSQAKAYADAFKVKKNEGFFDVQPCETFPQGAYITWGIGHLVEIRDPKSHNPKWTKWSLQTLPIIPEEFKFQIAKGKAKQFAVIRKLIYETDIVINACDVDREGSNIFYSIFEHTRARNKTIKRLWINSLEVDEVRKGFLQLHDNKKDLLMYEEAKARQMSDWLVGMNGSRLYTLLIQKKGIREVFSIGRVQSPTVYLIHQRTLEIENFVPEAFYELEGTFKAEHGTYKGKVKGKINVREEAQELLRKHQIDGTIPGTVSRLKTEDKKTLPPKLHALSTIQATANRKWKYSPANVLKTMQTLYEKKLVTYPRTDTQFITPNEFSYLENQVEAYQKLINQPFNVASRTPSKRYVDSSKVQEHYAIIPTKKIPTAAVLARLSSEERNLYEEVLRTTLAMFHSNYLYQETSVTTDVNGLAFLSMGKVEIDKGWKVLFSNDTDPKASKEPSLPKLSLHEQVKSKVAIKEGQTTPPKPYTEGQLIAMMKTCGKFVEDAVENEILKEVEGLGTEATRSGIIETIKRNGYIEVKKNIVSITEKGRVLCEAIEGNLLASPAMTAKWETYLKKIGTGTGSSELFLGSIAKYLNQLILDVPMQLHEKTFHMTAKKVFVNKDVATCPTCQKGTIISREKFYGCSGYKEGCKQTFPATFLRKRLSVRHIEDLCTKGKTEVIKGLVSKVGKTFDAKLVLTNGQLKLDFL